MNSLYADAAAAFFTPSVTFSNPADTPVGPIHSKVGKEPPPNVIGGRGWPTPMDAAILRKPMGSNPNHPEWGDGELVLGHDEQICRFKRTCGSTN